MSKPPQPEKEPASTSTSSEETTARQADNEVGPGFLVVAQVLSAHGVRGELKCRIVTDFPKQRFRRNAEVILRGATRTIESARVQGDQVLLKLAGLDDRTAAETFRGAEVEVPSNAAVHLPRGQFYWHQVIGLRVENAITGAYYGRVTDILETGANDVYIVRPDSGGRELLIPAIKDVVKRIDPDAGRILIELLPGMLPD